jgi:WD40 repeat protein
MDNVLQLNHVVRFLTPNKGSLCEEYCSQAIRLTLAPVFFCHSCVALKCNPTKIKILPDEQYAVASGDSLSLEILEINTLKVVRRIQGHEDWIVCLDWYMRDNSPSIMSMCSDSTLRVWLYGEAAKKSELYDLPIQAAMLDLGPGA